MRKQLTLIACLALFVGISIVFSEHVDGSAQTANADLTASPISGVVPLGVGFAISVGPPSDPACAPDAWSLNFGDGTPPTTGSSSGPFSASHEYLEPGTFTARLTYTREQNFSSTSIPDCRLARATATAVVIVRDLLPLNLQFSITPQEGDAPLDVTFDASQSSTDGSCSINASQWDFGDGNSANGLVVQHTYTTPGEYLVNITIGDSCGRSADGQGSVRVRGEITGPDDLIARNLPLEPEIKPACHCASSARIHTSGIGQIPTGCNKCATIGRYPGIDQDAGPNSVLLHSGEYVHRFTHLSIPGRGFDWEFSMKYRSGITYNGPLGHNWELNYNRRLVEVTESNLAESQASTPGAQIGDIVRMDGLSRSDLYVLQPDGSYRAPTGFYTQLIETADGYVERDQKGALVEYFAQNSTGAHLMTSLSDRNGNTMRFEYDETGQLISVTDTLGREITYSYNDEGYISEVRDFIGRTVTMSYDANGDLVSVTSPSVTGTPNGNDFPTGKTIEFSYSSGFEDKRFNHNLLAITAPNEVAAGGAPRYTLAYNTDPTSPSADRVITQQIGGTNASGEPASGEPASGGTISYTYDGNTTSVVDRNGNRTLYAFNELGNIVSVREFTNRDIRSSDPEFYETTYEYNNNGEMTRMVSPEGNIAEYVYDDASANPHQRGNLVRVVNTADVDRGGDQDQITTSFSYESIYNQIRTLIDPRGNDSDFSPPNGGSASAARYTTTFVFDYQEGDNYAALAELLGISQNEVEALLADIPMNLGDVNGDGLTNQIAGNIVQIISPSPTLLNDSNQVVVEGNRAQPIVETMVYNQFGLMTRSVDPEGNVYVNEFYPENDPDGDGQNVINGTGSGPFGYLRATTVDAEASAGRNSGQNPPPAAITTRYAYDAVGNITRIIDGRGIATDYVINELNQIVEVRSASDVTAALDNPNEPDWNACRDAELVECVSGMAAFGYRTRVHYDHNNNVVLIEVENSNSNNQSFAGEFIEFNYKYNILDDLAEMSEEVSESEILTTRYHYDNNQNLVLVQSPMSVNGEQPSNIISFVIDERDLVFTSTRGGTTAQFDNLAANANITSRLNVADSADISTTQHFFDGNRNTVRVLDANDTSTDGELDETLALYDGYDRLVSIIDPVGNQTFVQYDPAGNALEGSFFGPLGGSTPIDNSAATTSQPLSESGFAQPLLAEAEYLYDELSRHFETRTHLFTYDGVDYERDPELVDGPLGGSNDGLVITRYEYDRNSRLTFHIEDDGDTYQNFYDGLGRLIRSIDPEGNEVLRAYDDNHNLIEITEIDRTSSTAMMRSDIELIEERFSTSFLKDSLDRTIRVVDNIGQTTRYHYDSRGNLIFTSDAVRSEVGGLMADPLGVVDTQINRPGNTAEAHFDGLNRLVSVVRQLRTDGMGENPIDTSNSANPDGLVVTDYQYDANSRLIAVADDGSSAADQNRSIGVIEPSDPLGNVTSYEYDDLNRLVRNIYDDGTLETFIYDLDDNLSRSIDLNGTITDYFYDGLNRTRKIMVMPSTSEIPHPEGGFKDPTISWEVVGTTAQTFEYDGLSRLTLATDDNNPDDAGDDAVVTNAYDSLSRLLEQIQNGGVISSQWDGEAKRLGLIYPNGRDLTFTHDALDRITTIGDAVVPSIADYNYIGGFRVLERTLSNGVRLSYLDETRTQDVGYDNLRRVVNHSQFTNNDELVVGFEYDHNRANFLTSETKLHLDDNNVENYTYDSLYRLSAFNREGQSPDTFEFDGANNWVNRSGAENTATNMNEYSEFNGVPQLYDDNGNLIDDGERLFTYDAGNRLRSVSRKSDGALIAEYTYDVLGRRIAKRVSNSGDLDGTTSYLYDGWHVIEEVQDELTQQYVYGLGIDEPLTLNRDVDSDGTIDERFFYHQDGKGYVAALTNESGDVVEEITYDAFGVPSITQSSIGNSYLFNGRRYEPETGLYYNRARFYNPEQGRFIQRDPIGSWGDVVNMGNAYGYVGNSPASLSDPSGLETTYYKYKLEQARVSSFSNSGSGLAWGPGGGQSMIVMLVPAVQKVRQSASRSESSESGVPGNSTLTGRPTTSPAALLVPAVQRVRESASKSGSSASKPKEIVVVGSKVKDVVRSMSASMTICPVARPKYQGGVNIAVGDINGDGFSDIIVGSATSPSASSHMIRVYGYSGAEGAYVLPHLEQGNLHRSLRSRSGHMLMAAIAIPNLLDARKSGNESSAIGTLRAVNNAQGLFNEAIGVDMFEWVTDEAGVMAAVSFFTIDSFSFGVEREMKESGEKGGTADINIGVGEL